MSGRGRQIATGIVVLALVLAGGRWAAGFRAERLWEASLGSAVAPAGASRALAGAALELLGIGLTAGWLLLHFGLAARIALPVRRPTGVESVRSWPRAIPRWSVAAAALVTGIVIGSGLGNSLDHLRLALDGARLGVPEPLTDQDLGVFLGSFPFWAEIQRRAVLLSLVALAGAVLLHGAGGMVRLSGHRVRVAPRARGQLALLLALLAAALAWDGSLDPLRLAAGLRGPVLSSEFVLRSLLAYLVAGLGALAAALSLLWWIRVRGSVAFVCWLMFALARIGTLLLPLHPETALADPSWRFGARVLDSVAFQLFRLDRPAPAQSTPAARFTPTLWDDSVMARVMASSTHPHRGWLPVPHAGGRAAEPPSRPVWLGIRAGTQDPPVLVAVSDDRVASTGAPLSYEAWSGDAVPGIRPYRELSGSAISLFPGAPRIGLAPPRAPDSRTRGVSLDRWHRRLILAWAWQAPGALTAPRGSRIDRRLEPAARLEAVAPFAHWSAPRLRVLETQLVWQSDGLLVSSRFPSSSRIPWPGVPGGTASMIRTAFVGTVDAATGAVRIFRRALSDSLAAAWARVAAPLIEPAENIPAALGAGEAYPVELALAQARVLAGPAWDTGQLAATGDEAALPPEAAGGTEQAVLFLRPGTRAFTSMLLLRRTPDGDSLRLLRFDPVAPTPQSAPVLRQRWERFPFQLLLRDSILAAGARFQAGAVRYALAEEGVIAYQPAWAENPGGRPRLALVNVALGERLGTGRTFAEAWQNLRGEVSPAPVGAGAKARLDEVRRWWLHADSALKRGDLAELGRALSYLRELLERQP